MVRIAGRVRHRLSTVRRSNRIITIDRGRLAEDGTREELINKGGRYATLHRVQADIHESALELPGQFNVWIAELSQLKRKVSVL